MTEQRSSAEHVLDLLLYAPVGLLGEARTLLPGLVEKGRMHVGNARMMGQFAVQMGQSEAERRIGKLEAQAKRSLADLGLLPPDPAEHPLTTHDHAAPVAVPTPAPERVVPRKPVVAHKAAASKPAARTAKATAPKAAATKASGRKAPAATHTSRPTAASSGPPAAGSLAIPSYDSLAASQVVSRLVGLRKAELTAVQQYEMATRGRKTILGKIAQLQAG